jgi:endonuclease YncB( thermonuclease family)
MKMSARLMSISMLLMLASTLVHADEVLPVITVNGDANMTLEASRNGQYMDLGATCTSNVGGNLNHAVVVSGQIVDMRVPGTYTIQYSCTDDSGQSAQPATRNIEVQDTVPPVITLIGDANMTLEKTEGGNYVDPGATADDAFDGDISDDIHVSGAVVNLARIGVYGIHYDVTDASGNSAATVTRTVTVADTVLVITLIGDANMTLEATRNGQYMDLGATCTSNVGGNLNHAVVVSGQIVDMRVPGTYTIQYNCTDDSGQSAQPATRSVEVQDTLPPVITLSLEDLVIHVGDNTQTGLGGENNVNESQYQSTSENLAGEAFRLTNSIYREHDLSYTQPDGRAVKSRQDWTIKTAANSVEVLLPTATAWDRVDDSVEVAMRIQLIDLDGDGQTSVQPQVDWTRRSTYLFKYDVQDDSGNHAEQVVFALILNDLEEPSISLAGGQSQVIQAGSDWEMGQSTAHDNIDGDLTDQVRYAVHNTTTQAELGSDLSYADAAALVNTMTLGDFLVTVVVSDAAGIYGANSVNNTAQKQQALRVQDTLAPVITLIGDANMTLEATGEGNYIDPGATAHDAFDGDISNDVQVSGAVVNLAKVGVYGIHYDATDASGNSAATVTRTVTVVNTNDPPIGCECPPDVAQSLCEELDIGNFGTTNTQDLSEVIRLHIEAAAPDSCLQDEIDQCIDDFLAAIGL